MKIARVVSHVVVWAALSTFSGTMLAALGAGSLSFGWVAFSSGFMGLLLSPILLGIFEN